MTLWRASVADVAACVAPADQPVGLYTHKYFLVWQLWQLVASVLMCRAAVFALASVFVRIRMHAAWIRHARREAEVAAVAATVAAVATEPSSANHRWISELDDVPPELPSKTSVVILVLVALGSVCAITVQSSISHSRGALVLYPSSSPPPLSCVFEYRIDWDARNVFTGMHDVLAGVLLRGTRTSGCREPLRCRGGTVMCAASGVTLRNYGNQC
eukprot:COSAG01_NODE_9351_length_2472_cov_16.297092_2_plen_215_part_00